MSDDRKEEGASGPAVEPKQDREGEPGNAVPFVPYDDTPNIAAIHAQRRRAYSAVLGSTNDVFPPMSTAGGTALSAVGTLTVDTTVVSPWSAVRSEMIARLDAIEAGLRTISPFIEAFETAYREHARIGHNNPPEDIDILPIGLAELQLGIVAANLARTEVNTEHPRSDVIRLCGLVLNWIAALVSACLKWIGTKGDVYVDSFLKALGPLTAAAVCAKLAGVHVNLTEVVTKIRQVFELLHLSL
jgi:hypothetical protein